MPRLKNSLPKYRKKSVRGRTYGVVTLDGKDHYVGDYGTETSKRDYDRLIAEWLANGRCLPNKTEQAITITNLIVVYWRHCKTHYVKNGQPARTRLRRFQKRCWLRFTRVLSGLSLEHGVRRCRLLL